MPHITEKELLMISDNLLEHETIIEKLGAYQREVDDPEVQSMIQRHQAMTQRHYQELVNIAQPQGGYRGTYQTSQQAVYGGVQPVAYQGSQQSGYRGSSQQGYGSQQGYYGSEGGPQGGMQSQRGGRNMI